MRKWIIILCLLVGGCASVERIPLYMNKDKGIFWLEVPKEADVKYIYIRVHKENNHIWEAAVDYTE